jgi:uncharacterized RDD family membrane protein YckC
METPPESAASPSGRRVRMDTLRLDPDLGRYTLASPVRRLGALLVDLGLVAVLSVLSGPLLGLGTAVTLWVLGSLGTEPTRAWKVVRWVHRGLAVFVAVGSIALMAGRPVIRSDAFHLDDNRGGTLSAPRQIPPGTSSTELRRAFDALAAEAAALEAENARLRGAGASWVSTLSDFGATYGLTFGWGGVYFTLTMAALGGRTFGKRLFGTRVIRIDGRPLTPMDAFIRYGGYAAGLATGLIGFARLLWEPNRQAIQDKIAWTVVVRD